MTKTAIEALTEEGIEDDQLPPQKQPLAIAPGLQELRQLLLANSSLITIDSHNCELDDVLEQIWHQASKAKFNVYHWRLNEKPEQLGISELKGNTTGVTSTPIETNLGKFAMPQQEVLEALNWMQLHNPQEKAVFIVSNIHPLIHSTLSQDLKIKDKVLSLATRWNAGDKNQKKRLILLGQDINPLPNDFLGIATELSVELPDFERIKSSVDWHLEFSKKELLCCKKPIELKNLLSQQEMQQLYRSFQSFTLYEVARILRIAIRKFKVKDAPLIVIDHQLIDYVQEQKKNKLKRLGIHVQSPPETPVVGLEVWNDWLNDELMLIQSPAKEKYNTPYAKGAILLGPPGTGKTSAAAAIASKWGIPAFRFSWDSVLDKYVGNPEKNFRQFLKTVELISPCVLIIDEFNQSFGGLNNDVNTVMKRLHGEFLTWLADKKSPVLVVATTNKLDGLDLALTRKGRFDEIFYMGLPTLEERIAILHVHLQHLKVTADVGLITSVAKDCDGWVGAELVSLAIRVQRKLLLQLPDIASGPEWVTATKAVFDGVRKYVHPMIEIPENREAFSKMQDWGKKFAVNASTEESFGDNAGAFDDDEFEFEQE